MKILNRNNLKFKKIIYPAILGALIVAGILIFIYSIRFLSREINRSFFIDSKIIESKTVKVDRDNLKIISEKLGVRLGEADVSAPSSAVSSLEQSSSASSTASAIIQLDKTTLKISILNGTKIKGVAAGLKDIMTKDGFIVSKTGNLEVSPPLGGETSKLVIKIKNSRKDYLPLVKESVLKKYATIEDKEMDETGEYDIIITIGGK